MRKVIYGICVALLTFAIGAAVHYLTAQKHGAPPAPASNSAAVRVDQKPEVKAPPVPVNVSIILRTNLDDKAEFKYRTLKLSSDKTVVVDDIDVPEYVDGQEITIRGSDPSARFWISERYRTSMTVMGEGPHLDLVDWRHFDSEWIPLERIADRKFRTLASERMDGDKFPGATQAEIMAAVRKRAGDWPEAIELAKKCRAPNEYPCGVSVSSVFFRVEMLVGDQWTNVGVVEVQIPMGC